MSDHLPLYESKKEPDEGLYMAAYDMRFMIVASRFNEPVVNRLIEGAIGALEAREASLENINLIRVPGAMELAAAVHWILKLETPPDAIITLGCVIRGDTPHFDYVCSECARRISKLACDSIIPVTFGVLTTDNQQQADLRSALLRDDDLKWGTPKSSHGEESNKGAEAAIAALEMLKFTEQYLEIRKKDESLWPL